MAAHGDTDNNLPTHDIAVHRADYDAFMTWAKWGTVACFLIAAVVVVILAS